MTRPALPVHPYRKLADRQVRLGASFAGIGLLFGGAAVAVPWLASLLPLSATIVVLGGAHVRLGRRSQQRCDALVARGIAIDLGARGDDVAAEAVLDALPVPDALMWRAFEVHRAQLALDRGDPAGAEARTTAVIARPIRGASADVQRTYVVHAQALRALALASLGKDAGPDVAAVRASGEATPETLALAAVAEQVMLSRRGELEALARALDAARPLFETTPARERALVRAFRGLVAAKRTSAYREPGRADDVVHPVDGWAARIAPEVAAYLPETERRARTTAPDVPRPAGTVAREIARPKSGHAFALRVAVAVAIAFGLCDLLFSLPREDGSVSVVAGIAGVLALVSFFGRFRRAVALEVEGRQAVRSARLTLARGEVDAAEKQLGELARSTTASAAAEANLELAQLAERRTDLKGALAFCDAGLALLLGTRGAGAPYADLLLPRLVSERAFVLAALGRDREAHAELAVLAGDYPFFVHLTGALFRTRLLLAVRSFSTGAATELARERTPRLPLGVRDETLADAVVALADGHPRELARLHEELTHDAELARWLDLVVPGARVEVAKRVAR